ncbi:4Fe-4S binding protein [Donghicola mangrovi]|uniref:4Fe-4S binding protein n=1 Tax=Donghicola mangrovi TaxID=2729614 RepID=A0A850QDH6_9RHOB|nr:4Fe-4S binding protein [Donghicola mangrovi]NVO23921.1 4Fe-4S binding protein [Donghicola mangrovi]
MTKQLILCDCSGSQTIDADVIGRATGLTCSRIHTALCTREAEAAAKAISAGNAIIACQQEAQRFDELATELSAEPPIFVDIRDRAGWNDDKNASAKMAALVAESLIPAPAAKTVDVVSEGMCLIIGAGAVALPAAEKLADALAVTVLLTDDADLPLTRAYEVVRGKLTKATGTFGDFKLRIDGFQMLNPAGRGEFTLTAPRDGAETRCDVIVDLSGATSLFPAPHKRDGYLRADPGSQPAVADVIAQAREMVGTFEKTLYLSLEPHLCAHSRAEQTGCTRCLDICPTGAIFPAGEHVDVDPMVCAGCGACASLCPSGAIKYDAPPVSYILTRIRTLAETYAKAGGKAPRLLVHDDHGAEMISLSARFGRGLPADVIPLSISALAEFGHAEMLAALVSGFASVQILPSPRTERDPINREIALANAMGGDARLSLIDVDTPDSLSDALYGTEITPIIVAPKLMMGDRRQVARVAAKALLPDDQPVALPAGAPYGATMVNKDACTLCLSCVSLCPSGALVDNPDKPELRFQEDACLQCGICTTICPEKAITLEPRFNPSDEAMKLVTLNEEEPFCCIECGKPFGVKSTVEKIMEKLAGKHSMFEGNGAGRLIQMCDTCRIQAQYHNQSNPFASADRPMVRTTDDYLKRRDH